MKLEGSLDAFSLPDIFQLLSYTKKSGGLTLRHGASDGVVYFGEGFITGASADGVRQSLARRLIGSGLADDDALAAAVEAAQAAGTARGGLAPLLVAAGSVDAELVRQAATDQAIDAVFDLLRWPQGDFAFSVDAVNPDEVGIRLTTEAVVAEAAQRQTSWDAIAAVIPGPDTVLTMPMVLAGDPLMSKDEWALLALVDGRRRVGDLVELTGSGQFAVVSSLASLVERGLLHVRGEHDHVATVSRRQALLAPLEQLEATAGADPVETGVAAGNAAEPAETDADQSADLASADARHDADASGETDEADEADETDATAEPDTAAAELPADEKQATVAGADQGAAMAGTAGASSQRSEPAEATANAPAQPTSPPEPREAPAARRSGDGPSGVVPPRPEPFRPARRPDHPEPPPTARLTGLPSAAQAGAVASAMGATAVATDPAAALIERDPSVNRSLLLRLIAGVRGL